jgi:hypothetical protein
METFFFLLSQKNTNKIEKLGVTMLGNLSGVDWGRSGDVTNAV